MADCYSALRCAGYFNYGHGFKSCFSVAQPRLQWRPKQPTRCELKSVHDQLNSHEAEAAGANSISPPIHCSAEENPTSTTATDTSPTEYSDAPFSPDEGREGLAMANFAIDPALNMTAGMELEDWVRSAHSRIIISDNPLR